MNKQPTIRNGGDLFHYTDDKFDYWYADGYGVQPSFDTRAYKSLSLQKAREIRNELDDLIEFIELNNLDKQFGDL
jgi:hypothetical protein